MQHNKENEQILEINNKRKVTKLYITNTKKEHHLDEVFTKNGHYNQFSLGLC